MASKRRIRRRACEGKIAYTDEVEAAGRARALQKREPGQGWGWYRCEFGPHWHLGHRNKRRRASARAAIKRQFGG